MRLPKWHAALTIPLLLVLMSAAFSGPPSGARFDRITVNRAEPPVASEAASAMSAASVAPDVDSLRAWIDRIHPQPYRVHTSAEFDASAAALRGRIDDLPEHEAALELHRLLAMVGDGHTEFASLPPSLRGPGLPLIIRRFAEGWFVTTGHTDYSALFGRPIASVGGVPMSELARRLAPYVPADNETGRLDDIGNFMRFARILDAVGIPAVPGRTVDFVVIEEDGSRSTVPVEVLPEVRFGADWADAEKFLRPAVPEPLFRSIDAGNYGCRYLPDERAVYILFSEVRDDDAIGPIAEYFPHVLDFAERSDAERLVLDIRENSGGNLDLNGPILRGIIRSRFDRPGRLFVIIGDDTYSAAMHLAVTLERLAHPIFVGVPSGSRPNHYGDTRVLTLPRTGIEVEISELFWQQSDPRDRRPWITPDVPATPTMRDRLDGRDPALEAALTYEAPASLGESFGPPLSRWQRANQLSDESWPELLEPAARPVELEDRSPIPDPRSVESCED